MKYDTVVEVAEPVVRLGIEQEGDALDRIERIRSSHSATSTFARPKGLSSVMVYYNLAR